MTSGTIAVISLLSCLLFASQLNRVETDLPELIGKQTIDAVLGVLIE